MTSKLSLLKRLSSAPTLSEDNARIARWLQPERILFRAEVEDGPALLELAANEIARAHKLDAGPVFRALSRREQAESTALGNGFAIPHARIAGIEEPLTLLIHLDRGIPFHTPDAALASLFLVIMVPLGDQQAHLKLLAVVAELFSDHGFRLRMDRARDEEAAAAVFRKGIAEVTRQSA